MTDLHWKTAVTKIESNKISVRGKAIDELMGNTGYAQMVYLLLKGEMPSENIGKMIETILVSSVDHGTTPPSALCAITVASTGAPLNAAVAAGILAISRFHGGAIEDCMKILKQGMELGILKEMQLELMSNFVLGCIVTTSKLHLTKEIETPPAPWGWEN